MADKYRDKSCWAIHWAALLWIALLGACMPMLPKGSVSGPETYRVITDIYTGGFQRDYHLHIPPGYDGRKKLPMVVVVHGSFDTAKGVEKFTQFSTLADQKNFIVLYPNGIGIFGFFQHWNAGHCCGKAAADKLDDVGFVTSAIESTRDQLAVDADRIYMIGFSNGGMFVHRFAAEKGNLLAGAAALAGSICSYTEEGPSNWQIPTPHAPLPILVMHAKDDEAVPYDKVDSQRRGGPSGYCSVEESVAFWLKTNGCAEPTTVQSIYDGQAERTQWANCSSQQPVELYSLKKWGHVWPGRYFTARLDPNHPMKSFDAAEIAWDFFQIFKR